MSKVNSLIKIYNDKLSANADFPRVQAFQWE